MTLLRAMFLCCLLLSLGCRGDDNDGYPQTCQLACERAAYCDPQSDPRSCAGRCGVPQYQPPLSKRYLDAVRRCLDATPCQSVPLSLSGDQCAYEEALRLPPSKPARDLCSRAYDSDRRCGASTLDAVTCIDDVKLYEDDLLRRVTRCYDLACREQSRCVYDLFGYGFPVIVARP